MEIVLYVAGPDDKNDAAKLVDALGAQPDDRQLRVVDCSEEVLGDEVPGAASRPDAELLPLVTLDGVQVVVSRLPSEEELEWLLDNAATAQALARGENRERPERFSVPRRIHINMHVHNLSRTLPFYEVLLGAKPTKRREDYAKFELEDPPVNLALEQVKPDVKPKIDHLGIEVKSPEAVMEHRARYLQAGFKLTEELQVECCYSEQNKIWALDPHGLRWEVVNVVGDIESEEACPADCICWTEFDENDRSVVSTDTAALATGPTQNGGSAELATAGRVLQVYESAAQCGKSSLCCAPGELYSPEELAALPDDVRALSSGCGNPVALATVQPGQTVVDIGSGAGTDAILAGRLVGPAGQVIGVDPSATMRERAARAAEELQLDWVTFLDGSAEHLPLADASADLVISNCVLAMSTQPAVVWSEIARVLRPAGTFVIADTVGSVSAATPEARARCEVGLTWDEYLDQFDQAGLVGISALQAGPVQYRDGSRVQSATICGHRPGAQPHVAIQLFGAGGTSLANPLREQLEASGVTADITAHDLAQPADRQLLAVLLPQHTADPQALTIIVNGRQIATWLAEPDDALVAAVRAYAIKAGSSTGPARPTVKARSSVLA